MDMSLLNFMVETYEQARTNTPQNDESVEPEDQSGELHEDDEDGEEEQEKRGRPVSKRHPYVSSHPFHETRERVRRSKGHKTLPSLVGTFFPRNDIANMRHVYCASALALLKPWRDWSDLKRSNQTWMEAFAEYEPSLSRREKGILANLQYYHESGEAARKAAEKDGGDETRGRMRSTDDDMDDVEEERDVEGGEQADENEILDEEEIRRLEANEVPERERLHGRVAVEIGHRLGVFNTRGKAPNGEISNSHSVRGRVGRAQADDLRKLEEWNDILKRGADDEDGGSEASPGQGTTGKDRGDVRQIENVSDDADQHSSSAATEGGEYKAYVETLSAGLLEDQQRAFGLVMRHVEDTMAGRNPPQLLMQLQGEGGTGKSRVINSITKAFVARGIGHRIQRAAYTGIAASIIDGKTLHTLASMPLSGGMPSKAALLKVANATGDTWYLILDECSMLASGFFGKFVKVLDMARDTMDDGRNGRPFGGINIILAGDFHQFPPVVSKASAPLYYPIHAVHDSMDKIYGKNLYQAFDTVVILEQQVRVKDPEWLDFLRHARHGTCEPHHIEMVRNLVLTNPKCPKTDFTKEPWSKATLITPRHAVRMAWNEEAVRKHCAETGETLFICRAQDRIGGKELTLSERQAIAQKKGSGKRKGRKERGGLPNIVELARGMEVMVTYNVDTDIDVANGARGRIVDIILNEEETADLNRDVVKLDAMPAYILVQMDRTKAPQLPDLEVKVLPIQPMTKTFEIRTAGGTKKTVHRTQLPVTAAYAFTDYRSQGQTLDKVVVDLGNPPSGALTPFNAYVALSRSSGRDSIRLLRDFDDTLFTTMPSVELEAEDVRLNAMNQKTKADWRQLLHDETETGG